MRIQQKVKLSIKGTDMALVRVLCKGERLRTIDNHSIIFSIVFVATNRD